MIKVVQVEERRVICDICNKNYYTMHGLTDIHREGWVHADNFANSGKNLDICPSCVGFLKSFFKTTGIINFSEYMNEPGSGNDGQC